VARPSSAVEEGSSANSISFLISMDMTDISTDIGFTDISTDIGFGLCVFLFVAEKVRRSL
jgi:hypothetical protein